jgi:formamidopyrimidine-DNA glycosylase
MPELPEVETVRRHLERHLVGRTIVRAWTSGKKLRRPIPRTLGPRLAGLAVLGVRRHGKFLLVDFAGGARLVAHLGMTGQFRFHATDPGPPAALPVHTHVLLTFEDGAALSYVDARRFGLLVWLAPGADERLMLGPPGRGVDPLAERLDGERLRGLYARTRGPIKPALLDQARIAGIGHIYACEVLFRAAIAPTRRAHALSAPERETLAREIHAVLDHALEHRGTTISDFRDLDDRPGGYATALLVYDRVGEACGRCGDTIRRVVQAGRSTYYCPGCQKRGRRAES